MEHTSPTKTITMHTFDGRRSHEEEERERDTEIFIFLTFLEIFFYVICDLKLT